MSADLEVDEVAEAVEEAEKVGRTFSLRAVLALLATTAGVSGFGGAATVQDQRLAEHERAIQELRGQVLEGTAAAIETRTTVQNLEDDVDDIKGDTKEIQRLLNQIIGRNGRDDGE